MACLRYCPHFNDLSPCLESGRNVLIRAADQPNSHIERGQRPNPTFTLLKNKTHRNLPHFKLELQRLPDNRDISSRPGERSPHFLPLRAKYSLFPPSPSFKEFYKPPSSMLRRCARKTLQSNAP